VTWKTLLKILFAGVVLLIVLTIIGAGLLLSKLPSAGDIKKMVTSPSASAAGNAGKETPTNALATQSADSPQNDESKPVQKKLDMQVVFEDFANERRPMVEVCRHLPERKSAYAENQNENSSADYFFKALSSEENRDPLIEAAAPFLRYIFRAPGMGEVIKSIKEAEDTNDPGILKKAELYRHLFRAATFLKDHTTDINQLIQKSYNLHMLTKAVALNPQLARDGDTLDFCEQMEKNINENGEYNADDQANEMLNFLSLNHIDPKTIGFDHAYRAKVQTSFTGNSLNLSDPWFESFFKKDIQEKMQK
jgi:hypothetical protein